MRTLCCALILAITSCISAGVPEEPRDTTSIAWVKCDGDGGFLIHMTPQAMAMGEPDRGCVVVHELDHIEYLLETGNRFCEGKKRNTRVSVAASEIDEMECRAYRKQVTCLRLHEGDNEEVARLVADIARSRFDCSWY